MELIALLSTGKGSWGQVAGLINRGEWENIILIGNDFAEKFSCNKKHEFIKINPEEKVIELRDYLKEKLKEKIKGMEVALSIASGEGKEHMALISALLSIPVGIRLVVLTQDGIVDLTKQGKALLEKEEISTII
ncbi:MAG: hypothetical protein QXF25_00115 [Candidatus Pacearchaeota archaeon]